jgi:hypothetical protein
MNAGTVAKSCMGYGMLQYHTSTEEQDAMVMNLATVPTKATTGSHSGSKLKSKNTTLERRRG